MILEIITWICSIELLRLSYIYKYRLNKVKLDLNKINKRPSIKSEFPHILINIPLLREQKIIRETLDFWSNINYPKNKLKINLITTNKEGKSKDSTYFLLKNLLNMKKYSKLKIFNHIHYPHKLGRKASQLNFALDSFQNNSSDNCYIGVYDADSRPHLDSLIYLADKSLTTKSKVFQQYSFYFKNYNEVGFFGKAIAVIQTRWTLIHEYYFANKNLQKKEIQRLIYTIGHGLFIRSDIFFKMGKFPEDTPIEDIAFGYKLTYSNIKVTPLLVFDNCEVPNSFKAFVKQNSVWFSGDGHLSEHVKQVEIKTGNRIKNYIKLNLIRRYELFRWFLGSFIVFCLILINILNLNYFNVSLIIFSGILFSLSCTHFINTNKNLHKLGYKVNLKKGFILLWPFLIFRSLISSLGPIYYLITKNINKLFKRKYEVYKTER